MSALDAKHAVEKIEDELKQTVSMQPVDFEGSHAEPNTILVMFDGYPHVYKDTTDEIAKLGWRLSGQTRDTDGTVNLYFRKIGSEGDL